MSKLDPKPKQENPSLSWKDLNDLLQANFNMTGIESATIKLKNYAIPKEEIISEAEKQGYKVTELQGGSLRFE